MVYGIYGGDGPRIIIGVFPRTALTDTTSGNFGTLSGFYGGLKKNGTLSDEYNGQDGPATPFTDPQGPKNYTKAEKKQPSDKSEELGVSKAPSRNDFPRNRNGNASYLRAKRLYEESSEDVDVEKNLTPPVKVQTSEDYNESVQKGEIVVKNEETLENVTEGGLNGEIDPSVAIVANETAVKENIIEEDSIIIDSKSGVSGAGKNPSIEKLFFEINENFYLIPNLACNDWLWFGIGSG